MTRNEGKRNDEPRSESPSSTNRAEIARWADVAMYRSKPIKASEGPQVTLLSAPSDPLGLIAAQAATYEGKFYDNLADVPDEERKRYLEDMQHTVLAMPLESVHLSFSITGVTRSFTHQMVRQRTAAYAQESLRFSVIEDDFTDRVSLPPELVGVSSEGYNAIRREYERKRFAAQEARSFDLFEANEEWYEQQIDRLPEKELQLFHWENGVAQAQSAYSTLVSTGLPAESARGLLPHNITTRIKYNTNLRSLLDHIGLRTCTQAQFEWRAVAYQMMQAIITYGQKQIYHIPWDDPAALHTSHARSSEWQFNAIAALFSPVCYRQGKCAMKASFDRACKIRDRVDANAAANRPSSKWHLPLLLPKGDGGEMIEVAGPIRPSEWMLDPSAARA